METDPLGLLSELMWIHHTVSLVFEWKSGTKAALPDKQFSRIAFTIQVMRQKFQIICQEIVWRETEYEKVRKISDDRSESSLRRYQRILGSIKKNIFAISRVYGKNLEAKIGGPNMKIKESQSTMDLDLEPPLLYSAAKEKRGCFDGVESLGHVDDRDELQNIFPRRKRKSCGGERRHTLVEKNPTLVTFDRPRRCRLDGKHELQTTAIHELKRTIDCGAEEKPLVMVCGKVNSMTEDKQGGRFYRKLINKKLQRDKYGRNRCGGKISLLVRLRRKWSMVLSMKEVQSYEFCSHENLCFSDQNVGRSTG
ncbi:hypothetical protein Bca101_008752 [Brassica carinata]